MSQRWWTDRPGRNDEGFSTVAGAAVVAALAVLLVGALYVGAAVLARHRAQSAADLSALAAASAQLDGDDGCAAARSLVSAQEGAPVIDRCVVDGDDVQVWVTVSVRLGRLGVKEAVAVARAGPADGVTRAVG